MSGQCPSCGLRVPAAVLAGSGPAHCPRCGDPLPAPAPDGATVTVAPTPKDDAGSTVTAAPEPEAAVGSTAAPGSLTAAHDPDRRLPPASSRRSRATGCWR